MATEEPDPSKVQEELNKALENFKDESDRVDRDRALATREWLMNTAKETINIPLRGQKIRIRKRLTAEENKRIPNLYKLLAKSGAYKSRPDEQEASEKEFPVFISMVMVDPEVKPEDVNDMLTTHERHWISKKYNDAKNFDLLENMSEIPFFRDNGSRPADASDGVKPGTKPRGTRKSKAK